MTDTETVAMLRGAGRKPGRGRLHHKHLGSRAVWCGAAQAKTPELDGRASASPRLRAPLRPSMHENDAAALRLETERGLTELPKRLAHGPLPLRLDIEHQKPATTGPQ